MSLETLKPKVAKLIKKAQSGGGEDTLSQYFDKTLIHARSENVIGFDLKGFFANQKNLITADFPNLIRTNDNVFFSCEKLESVNIPMANYAGANGFQNCLSLEYISLPSAAIVYTESFAGATKLKTVDFGVTTDFARARAFLNCHSLSTLILRGNEVSILSDISNFNGGAFRSGENGGTIYVPSTLIEAYKTATNWSALYESGRCNFVAIEGSEYE